MTIVYMLSIPSFRVVSLKRRRGISAILEHNTMLIHTSERLHGLSLESPLSDGTNLS